MARRTPRSEANEVSARTAQPDRGPQQSGKTPLPPETFAEPGEADDRDLDDEDRDIISRSMGSEPSEEDIRLRAYHRYLQRGGADGMDFDDWLEAERELKKP
jgi:hypothetical protein